ncbi:MAG: tRNA uridine-5-carboxymethylaminomethyl(34) synthesis GTPase MnmE, partial [Crocinitomicaceae bacterium]|nr:tRNA uridine-5-carboxymethylaminomethyl(34) synthesis GTPase MnmE [Crocinitomicaceae bacterium]
MIDDTICALVTPNGVGAIGVIRVSGPNAIAIVSDFFSKNIKAAKSHTLHFGTFSNKQAELIDEVLLSIFHEGKSYTGEQSVEISCHGSAYVLSKVMECLIQNGCRTAEPGEFTKRAFLNGKLDLSQAEAVADLISSESKGMHKVALHQLKGHFSNELKQLREQLIDFASLIELELDFGEEDVEFADRDKLTSLLKKVLDHVQKLADTFALGNAMKKGVPVAIVGAPNTGKSTLLNSLIGEDRAIVSDIAGTTRDVIEETFNIDGILFRFIDTAGIRETTEKIESIGIERAKKKIAEASIVLCLSDSEVSMPELHSWANNIRAQFPEKHILCIQNKCDLLPNQQSNDKELRISAKTGTGLEELKKQLVNAITKGNNWSNQTIITSARHHEALLKTSEALEKVLFGLSAEISADLVALDIRNAMYHLG